jgi:Co/Zn/Cd efflux system component
MTAMANPDLSDIDAITMKRLRIMSSLSVGIFGLIGLGFFIIFHTDEKISSLVQHRQNLILAASGIALLAGGIALLVITFWGHYRSLDPA